MQKWKKGNGEYIGFTVIASVIFFVFIMLAALIQFSVAVHSLNQSLSAIGRAAAMCDSMENAKKAANNVAKDSLYVSSIEKPKVTIGYAMGDKWETGNYIKVTVSAKINTLDPWWTSKKYGRSCIIGIEGGASEKYLGKFRITFYYPGDGYGQIGRETKMGVPARAYHTIAVDPKVIPLGSQVRIGDYVYTAEDIGGAIDNNHIDVFVEKAEDGEYLPDYADVYLLQ